MITNSNDNLALDGKNILLIISGGIAAYKSLELIRQIRKSGGHVRCVLTRGGQQFVTPLSVSALCEEQVFTDLWSLKDETEMGHIRLSREADLIVIAPASANMIAKMVLGLADDLASTMLLANDKPVLVAPAMNHKMWDNPATQSNIETLKHRGVQFIGPDEGEMACNEYGMGRMSAPEDILSAICRKLSGSDTNLALKGMKALVTSGPTYEPIDPVRFIGNRSSGKQGHAIAKALRDFGADVTLVTGPVAIADPSGVNVVRVNTALEMLDACRNELPCDIAVCAAAVSDWSAAAVIKHKIKKRGDKNPPDLKLKENPDILKTLARLSPKRPKIVVGFAAETEKLIDNAREKLNSKKCDFVLANNVRESGIFGSDKTDITLVHRDGEIVWGQMSKTEVAERLVKTIIESLENEMSGLSAAE